MLTFGCQTVTVNYYSETESKNKRIELLELSHHKENKRFQCQTTKSPEIELETHNKSTTITKADKRCQDPGDTDHADVPNPNIKHEYTTISSMDSLAGRLDSTSLGGNGPQLSFSGRNLVLETEENAKEVVNQILETKDLKSLELMNTTVGVEGSRAIGDALKTQPLFTDALWSDMFTGKLIAEIPPALNNLFGGVTGSGARLQILDLSDNAIGPRSAPPICTFLKTTNAYSLHTLKLNNCGLGSGGQLIAKALIECAVKSKGEFKLKVFVAGRNRLESPGADALAQAFAVIGTLEEIQLPQNGIYENGILSLADSFRANPNLRYINLTDNTLKTRGSQALADSMKKLVHLERVKFDDCLTKDNGAYTIVKALEYHHNCLEEISLTGNEITPKGAEMIASTIGNHPHMKLLRLGENCFGSRFDQVIDLKKHADFLDPGNESDDQGSAGEEGDEGDEGEEDYEEEYEDDEDYEGEEEDWVDEEDEEIEDQEVGISPMRRGGSSSSSANASFTTAKTAMTPATVPFSFGKSPFTSGLKQSPLIGQQPSHVTPVIGQKPTDASGGIRNEALPAFSFKSPILGTPTLKERNGTTGVQSPSAEAKWKWFKSLGSDPAQMLWNTQLVNLVSETMLPKSPSGKTIELRQESEIKLMRESAQLVSKVAAVTNRQNESITWKEVSTCCENLVRNVVWKSQDSFIVFSKQPERAFFNFLMEEAGLTMKEDRAKSPTQLYCNPESKYGVLKTVEFLLNSPLFSSFEQNFRTSVAFLLKQRKTELLSPLASHEPGLEDLISRLEIA